MDIEKQIEDLCLERLKLEGDCTNIDITGSLEERAKYQAKRQINQAKIQAIDTQLDELRKEYAREYNASTPVLINDRLDRKSQRYRAITEKIIGHEL